MDRGHVSTFLLSLAVEFKTSRIEVRKLECASGPPGGLTETQMTVFDILP